VNQIDPMTSEEGGALAGRRVVITRAKEQAGIFADLLRSHGAEVIEFPTIVIQPPESFEPLDEAIGRLTDYDWVIFTSVNGVSTGWHLTAWTPAI
jgi:uroporphyrinogen III methyltransferase/synthase